MKRKIEIIFGILAIIGPILSVIGYASKNWGYFYVGLIFSVPIILHELWSYRTNAVQWMLKHRIIVLALTSISGIGLAHCIYNFFSGERDLNNPVLHSSLTILALGLPTFFILWLFRTRDVQENINNSTSFECARMLAEKYVEGNIAVISPQKIALEQLAYLKRKTSFDKEKIDILTKGLRLRGIYLDHARLSGLNLSRSKLESAKLNNADLSGVNLAGAYLGEVDLRGANLRGADLRGADLTNFIDDDKTKWKGAFYSYTTKFNGTRLESEANCKKEDMIYKSDEQK